MQPIGFVRSPYTDTAQIPKGRGAEHHAEGVLEILPEYEQGLADVEGFSHLYVVWVFDRSDGSSLIATPPSDNQPHGVFATRSPQRPNPIGLTVVTLIRPCCSVASAVASKRLGPSMMWSMPAATRRPL